MIDLAETVAEIEEAAKTPEFQELAGQLRTQLISGGLPYILVVVDPATGDAALEQAGFVTESLSEALDEIAAAFREGRHDGGTDGAAATELIGGGE